MIFIFVAYYLNFFAINYLFALAIIILGGLKYIAIYQPCSWSHTPLVEIFFTYFFA